MNINRWRLVCGLVMGLLLTGCIESTTVMRVHKDGSGSLSVQDFMSPQATSMMGGMEEMTAQFGEDSSDHSDIEGFDELPFILKGMLTSRLEEFGGETRLVSVNQTKNEQGWSGYTARFDFADVNQIAVSAGSGGDNDQSIPYRVEFTPGETATLRFIPAAEAKEVLDDEQVEMDEDFGGMMEGMDEAMMGMLKPMFAGMRMRLMVEVEGEIVDTDITHRSTRTPNRVTLVDLDMDEILNHPGAMSKLMQGNSAAMFDLHKDEVPGLIMQDPTRPATIRFR